MRKIIIMSLFILGLSSWAYSAALPPDTINYQGILRDKDTGEPLNGSVDMKFFLYDADTSGNQILIDEHLASGTGAVVVEDGLFNVKIGSGNIVDGSGSGTYSSLSEVFGDYSQVYLEIEVSGEQLLPRIQIVSSAYSLNTNYVEGFDLISSGTLNLYVSPTGDDSNDGLSPSTAKRSIRAALETIPLILRGSVIVHIEDGNYCESVTIFKKARLSDYTIYLQGNTANPENVVLDGSFMFSSGIEVYDDKVSIQGIKIVYYTSYGVRVQRGGYVQLRDSIIDGISNGIWIESASLYVRDSVIQNGSYGIWGDNAHILLNHNVDIQYNYIGIEVTNQSSVDCNCSSAHVIQNNTTTDMVSDYQSSIYDYGNATYGTCSATASHYAACEPGCP